jgi:PEP-CTERM motif-containing protein
LSKPKRGNFMKKLTILTNAIFVIGFIVFFGIISTVQAASFSIERYYTYGTEGSAINDSWGTGTAPNNVYNSDLSGTNTVGSSGVDTGTFGTQNQGWTYPHYGQDIDAFSFGPGLDSSAISSYYFSLDQYSGDGAGTYPEGSGTAGAAGTGTASSNVYSSTANGTNVNAFPGPDLGIEPYESVNLDGFDLQNFITPDSYPLYFSVDLYGEDSVDFYDNDDEADDVSFTGADILVSEGDGTFSVFLLAAELGLEDDDNLDALAQLSDGSRLFSTDWDSQGLEGTAVDLAGGTYRRPANIYQSFGDGTNTLWLSSEAFGIPSGEYAYYYGANLCALDVSGPTVAVVPEPASMLLMTFGLLGAGFFRRKKN